MGRNSISTEMQTKIFELLTNTTKPLIEIAEILNISPGTVNTYKTKFGVRKGTSISNKLEKMILESEEVDCIKIGKMFNTSPVKIRRIAKRLKKKFNEL